MEFNVMKFIEEVRKDFNEGITTRYKLWYGFNNGSLYTNLTSYIVGYESAIVKIMNSYKEVNGYLALDNLFHDMSALITLLGYEKVPALEDLLI